MIEVNATCCSCGRKPRTTAEAFSFFKAGGWDHRYCPPCVEGNMATPSSNCQHGGKISEVSDDLRDSRGNRPS